MFKLFKKKSQETILLEKYNALMQQAYELSKVNRQQSDQKSAEAELILKQIDALGSGKSKQP